MDRYANLQMDLVGAINLQGKSPEVPDTLGLHWEHVVCVRRANQLAAKLGQPATLDPEKEGLAIWRRIDPYFRRNVNEDEQDGKSPGYLRLTIKDEEIPHVVPVPHTDWFYAEIRLEIPAARVDDVRALTESVAYDTMSRTLTARCHFMPANLVTLYLAKQIAVGDKSLVHAQQEYVVLIPVLAKEEQDGMGLMSNNVGAWHETLTNYVFDL